MDKTDRLLDYLNRSLDLIGWSKAELARRTGISRSHVTDVLNKRANLTTDFCIAAAQALNDSPTKFLRLAGFIDIPPPVVEEETALDLFRRLPKQLRLAMIDTMKSLNRQAAPSAIFETRPPYNITGEHNDTTDNPSNCD